MGILGKRKHSTSLLQLSKNIGELKANFEEMQRKQAEVELVSQKTSALLEILKPDFIVKIKNQDISINSLKLELDSIKKLQETFIDEIKNLKRKLEFFDYQRVVEMDKETRLKLRNIERLNALTEKNSQKVESLFREIEKQYVEFKKFKAVGNKLENSFNIYAEKFNKFREESDKYLKEDDLSPLKKDIEKLKKDINKSSKKKVIKKSKKKEVKMDFLKDLGKWQKINLVVAILFLGGTLAFLAFSRPSITGYVSATYSMKDIEVIVLRDQNYFLNFKDDAKLKSVFMSGKVVGEGDARIFLESQGKQYLIFSSKQKKAGLDSITGFVVKETQESETTEVDFVPEVEDILPEIETEEADIYSDELKAYIDLLKKEDREEKGKKLFVDFIKKTDGYDFSEECIETCALFGLKDVNYKIIFNVDKGTTLFVDNIIYSVER